MNYFLYSGKKTLPASLGSREAKERDFQPGNVNFAALNGIKDVGHVSDRRMPGGKLRVANFKTGVFDCCFDRDGRCFTAYSYTTLKPGEACTALNY